MKVQKKEKDTNLLKKRKADETLDKVLADPKKAKIPKADIMDIISQNCWWKKVNNTNNVYDDDEIKCEYFENKAVLFTSFWQPHKIKLFYYGKKI